MYIYYCFVLFCFFLNTVSIEQTFNRELNNVFHGNSIAVNVLPEFKSKLYSQGVLTEVKTKAIPKAAYKVSLLT